MADTSRTQWWTTLPGVLTGIAALLTAVTGLALGLGQLGLLGGDDDRSAQATSQVTATPSPGDAPAPSASAEPPGTGVASTTLPLGQPLRVGEVSYELLDARVRPESDGLVALELSVRMTKHTPYDANFWDDSFRVAVGPDVHAASGGLNELVAGGSSEVGDVVVVVPDTTRQADLLLRFRDATRTVPFEISSAGA